MSERTDPFADIIAGLELSETGLREYEVIPEDAILALQGELTSRAQPYELEKIEDDQLAEVIIAALEKQMNMLLEKMRVFEVGDTLRFSKYGLVIKYSTDTGDSYESIGRGVSITGIAAGLRVSFAPVDPEFMVDPAPDDSKDHEVKLQVAVGVELREAKMEVKDPVTGLVSEYPLDDEAFVFVPFLYVGTSAQREITRTADKPE